MNNPVPDVGGKKELPSRVNSLGWLLLVTGIALAGLGYAVDPRRMAFDNVIGFLLVVSVAAGSVFLVALEYIGGAVWSVPMRRINEFLSSLTLLAPILAVPLFFHLHDIFHWLHPEALDSDAVLAGKSPYLNVNFLIIRFVAVFVLWNAFTYLFTRNSRRQDESGDPRLTTINIRLAAIFMPVFAITLTLTAIDWAMSLEPHWFSTIIGVYYFSGTVLAALSVATYIIVRLHENGYFPMLRRDHFYSLGALLFAFINFWAYIAFSQFLLIWYADLPEETFWFINRWHNGWEYVSVLLIIVHFAVPYFALLTQESKMDLKRLKLMSIWILVAHLLDLYWLVMPTYHESVSLSWTMLAFPVLFVGLTVVVLSYNMKRNNLVPIGDPKLARGLSFHL
ncbi:MAG: quinol:cytochrome C oxidoreductase [Ignavibacteria bacterium GWA2_54_16]|nr:MAG: quinol:cytochrome C oxidoreductase [Ignavibacteria bacterium GWA2_54_16]